MKPFEQVVAEYGPTVLRVCRAVLGPTEAEDAWSETFLAAMKAYPELGEGANIEAWLVTIAHRRAIDAWRAEARRPTVVDHVPERPVGAVEPGAWGDLWEALRALPHQQRIAVSYHYVAGLPYKEVATITGGSADAARRAASDGIRRLRDTYAGAAGKRGEER
ncbi:MAG: RNA polymerase sigma factor [Streptosporangiales bacterium]